MQFCCSACMTAYQQRLAPETIAKITAGSGGSPVNEISGKKTSGAVPGFLGITQRVSIAVVVALTGDYFRLVMLDFFSVAFAVATTGETSFSGDASFATGERPISICSM